MKKICFGYFTHEGNFYTPLDLAQTQASIQEKHPEIETKLIPIDADVPPKELKEQVSKFLETEADTYLFTLDNILWSMMFYAGAAELIAKSIKDKNPNAKIGFQSYKVTKSIGKKMFRDIPALDFCLRGEPEQPFLNFIKQSSAEGIKGFIHKNSQGKTIIEEEAEFLEDLDSLPSPYLSGTLDHFLEKFQNKEMFMATSRGCPFQCHYCMRGVRFSKVRTFSIERVLDELSYLGNKDIQSVFMLDDCFIVSHKRFKEFVAAYEERFKDSSINLPVIRIMCRPEFLSDEIIDLFPHIKVSWVQIGLQTLHPDSQYLMQRNLNKDDFIRISQRLEKNHIFVHLDLIIGLPHDTLEYFKKTFDFATELEPYSVQIKQLYNNPNTLFDLFPEKYGLKTEKQKHLLHVPMVKNSDTFSNEDIKAAAEYVLDYRYRNMFPKIKLITEFIRFNDFVSYKTRFPKGELIKDVGVYSKPEKSTEALTQENH